MNVLDEKEKIEILKQQYEKDYKDIEAKLERIEGKDPPNYMFFSGIQKQLGKTLKDLKELLN